MNYGKSLQETLEFSQELDDLHKFISRSELPVKKSDSFDKQCFLLEQYAGAADYQTTYRTMKRTNMLSLVTSLPVLLIIVFFFVYGRYIDREFDVFGYFIDHPYLYIVPGVLIVITLGLAAAHSVQRKKLYYRIYPELKSKLNIRT